MAEIKSGQAATPRCAQPPAAACARLSRPRVYLTTLTAPEAGRLAAAQARLTPPVVLYSVHVWSTARRPPCLQRSFGWSAYCNGAGRPEIYCPLLTALSPDCSFGRAHNGNARGPEAVDAAPPTGK